MQTALKAISVLVAAAALSACPFDGVSELKKNLGPYQYLGVDPQLSFSIQKAEFREPAEKYSVPTLNYTVNIKQNNAAFPLASYRVIVSAAVVDGNGSKLEHFSIQGKLENGVLAVSNIESLYGAVRKLEASRLPSLKMHIETYNWFPSAELQPYVPKT